MPHNWEKGVDEISVGDVQAELMGKSKLPEGMSRIGSEDFGFSGGSEEGKMDQIGLVPDVLQELKSVFATLSARDGNKRDFLEMMQGMRDKFPKIASHPSIGRINEFIASHAPFYLAPEELENLWD